MIDFVTVPVADKNGSIKIANAAASRLSTLRRG